MGLSLKDVRIHYFTYATVHLVYLACTSEHFMDDELVLVLGGPKTS